MIPTRQNRSFDRGGADIPTQGTCSPKNSHKTRLEQGYGFGSHLAQGRYDYNEYLDNPIRQNDESLHYRTLAHLSCSASGDSNPAPILLRHDIADEETSAVFLNPRTAATMGARHRQDGTRVMYPENYEHDGYLSHHPVSRYSKMPPPTTYRGSYEGHSRTDGYLVDQSRRSYSSGSAASSGSSWKGSPSRRNEPHNRDVDSSNNQGDYGNYHAPPALWRSGDNFDQNLSLAETGSGNYYNHQTHHGITRVPIAPQPPFYGPPHTRYGLCNDGYSSTRSFPRSHSTEPERYYHFHQDDRQPLQDESSLPPSRVWQRVDTCSDFDTTRYYNPQNLVKDFTPFAQSSIGTSDYHHQRDNEDHPLRIDQRPSFSLDVPCKNEGGSMATECDDIPGTYKDDIASLGCTCKKSKCLKLYCQCFASRIMCGPVCRCIACLNTSEYELFRNDAIKSVLIRNPSAFDTKIASSLRHKEDDESSLNMAHKIGCKCRKSACLKKYCECFNADIKCSDLCRCVDCRNVPPEDGAVSSGREEKYQEVVLLKSGKSECMMDAAQNLAFLKNGSPPRTSVISRSSPSFPSLVTMTSSGTSKDDDSTGIHRSSPAAESSHHGMDVLALVALNELKSQVSAPVVKSPENNHIQKRKTSRKSNLIHRRLEWSNIKSCDAVYGDEIVSHELVIAKNCKRQKIVTTNAFVTIGKNPIYMMEEDSNEHSERTSDSLSTSPDVSLSTNTVALTKDHGSSVGARCLKFSRFDEE